MKEFFVKIFQFVNEKIAQIERDGDELLRTNPNRFHNNAIAISFSVAAIFFSSVALINFFK